MAQQLMFQPPPAGSDSSGTSGKRGHRLIATKHRRRRKCPFAWYRGNRYSHTFVFELSRTTVLDTFAERHGNNFPMLSSRSITLVVFNCLWFVVIAVVQMQHPAEEVQSCTSGVCQLHLVVRQPRKWTLIWLCCCGITAFLSWNSLSFYYGTFYWSF